MKNSDTKHKTTLYVEVPSANDRLLACNGKNIYCLKLRVETWNLSPSIIIILIRVLHHHQAERPRPSLSCIRMVFFLLNDDWAKWVVKTTGAPPAGARRTTAPSHPSAQADAALCPSLPVLTVRLLAEAARQNAEYVHANPVFRKGLTWCGGKEKTENNKLVTP